MLEIGTIIYLKGGTQKLMILNRGAIIQKDNQDIVYDYSACVYPIGFSPEHTYYFNEENIDKIVYRGFRDEDEERFEEMYMEWKANNKEQIKGSV